MLHCARQKALPMLMAWLLEDCASFQRLLPNYGSQHKTLDALRLSVQQELATKRVFITQFLSALEEHGSDVDHLMATHIPETFICDGGGTSFDGGDSMLSFKCELDKLRVSYAKTHGCDGSLRSAIQKDILDPSLRCRVYNDGKDQAYMWLPTEFHVGGDGAVTVLSPLHGSTHPHQFPGLYAVIPRIFGRLLPLFERVLGSIATQDPPSPYQVGLGSSRQPEYNPSDDDEKRTGFSLRGRQLQVVVKLSTVELDESHPVFAGDQYHDNCNRGWQLDGDDCDNIVSVGYHVLRSRNITPPRLAFRAFAHCPTAESESTSQEGLFLAFGERTSAFHGGRYGRQFLQPWGSLVLHEGRSIVAPSFLAHRFEPFELLDATNPEGGELTLATFYLVDPTRDSIVSTRTVRPEQWQQTRRFVQANVGMLRCSSIHFFLPDEVSTRIADFAASHVSESQAQLTRHLLLMQRQKLQELRFMTPSLRLEGEIILHFNEDDE